MFKKSKAKLTLFVVIKWRQHKEKCIAEQERVFQVSTHVQVTGKLIDGAVFLGWVSF